MGITGSMKNHLPGGNGAFECFPDESMQKKISRPRTLVFETYAYVLLYALIATVLKISACVYELKISVPEVTVI